MWNEDQHEGEIRSLMADYGYTWDEAEEQLELAADAWRNGEFYMFPV